MSKDLNKRVEDIENDIEHIKNHIGKLYLKVEELEAMILLLRKRLEEISDLEDRIEYLESDIEKIKDTRYE